MIIEGKIIDTYKDGDNVNFIFSTEINGNTIYWTIGRGYFNFNDTPSFNSDRVKIEWNEKRYIAKLIVSEDKTAYLNRYFFEEEKIEEKFSHVEAVKCPSCGYNISIGDKKEIVCPACNTNFSLSDEKFKDVLTAAEIKKKNASLYEELFRLFSAKKFAALPYIAYYLFVFQVFLIAYYLIFAYRLDNNFSEFLHDFFESRSFVIYLVIPSFVFTIFALFITRKNTFNKDILTLASLFSPVIKDKDTISCRNCGSALKYEKIPDIVVCPYCKSENVILPNSIKKIKKKLDINLIDIKILYGKYRRSVNMYFFFSLVGIVFFYTLYILYTFILFDPDEVHFLIRYLIPFVVFILTFILLRFPLQVSNPDLDIIALLPENFRKGIEFEEKKKPRLIKFSVRIGLVVNLFFFVAQFLDS